MNHPQHLPAVLNQSESEISCFIIVAVYELFLVVVLVDSYRRAEIGWNNQFMVIIGFRIIDFRIFAFQYGLYHQNAFVSQDTGILEYGHRLLARNDVLMFRIRVVSASPSTS